MAKCSKANSILNKKKKKKNSEEEKIKLQYFKSNFNFRKLSTNPSYKYTC